jgi:hypothetical protein
MEHGTGIESSGAHGPAIEALEALAGDLPREHFSTALTMGPGRPPHLMVVHRDVPGRLAEVYVQDGWYWWVWGEQITTTDAAGDAAVAVTKRLRPSARS